MYCGFGEKLLFFRVLKLLPGNIDHENIGVDTSFVTCIASFQDIDENRFFGNDVTNWVFLAGKPWLRPRSNAFL